MIMTLFYRQRGTATLKGICILVNNESSSGWLLDDTKPLPGPMMVYEKSIANALLDFTD